MIKLENYEIMGWEHAIRGMRNPMNSWAKSDSEPGCEIVTGSHEYCRECDDAISVHGNIVCGKGYKPDFVLGFNDKELMMKLANAGPVHGKFRRMITVYVDVTAPLYWWKEFDTYKVGTVANSCSTMHKIHEKEFTLEDFSCEHLMPYHIQFVDYTIPITNVDVFGAIINILNAARQQYIETKDKSYWWQMIQLLPSSYNQRRTVQLNYEVLAGIYKYRKNHKLDEWREFCEWIEQLPYSEIITGGKDDE